MTQQPIWKAVANLGDVNPEAYASAFVLVDQTGVYDPEIDCFEPPDGDAHHWERYRWILDPCTYRDGILSDNPYHPELPAWWAQDLSSVAYTCSMKESDLINLLCSDDPITRARGYLVVAAHWGMYEMTGGNVETYKGKYRLVPYSIIRKYQKQIEEMTRCR
jgi:hypothetical protein